MPDPDDPMNAPPVPTRTAVELLPPVERYNALRATATGAVLPALSRLQYERRMELLAEYREASAARAYEITQELLGQDYPGVKPGRIRRYAPPKARP